jgi:hypothetical protein
MEALFFTMPVVVLYMDDTVIFEYTNFRMHLTSVIDVLKCLQEAGT